MSPEESLEPVRLVVGTAGHIDHGKTSLVAALTGIDCDRLIEEKERGITIDLGFAHLEHDPLSGRATRISFVDVPGHERFVHNALAGLGGIRLMMLVVAADEGVMPQTREHLAICSLLEIPAGLVALTKSDLVDAETLELAQLELEEALVGTPFAQAPIVAVSAKSGKGLDLIRDTLLQLAAGQDLDLSRRDAPFRLPIDRSFHLRGLGLAVTGTLHSGTLSTGQVARLLPEGASARIRSLQVHGSSRDIAYAGERTSAQLSGVDLAQVERGVQLVAPDGFIASRGLLVKYRHLPGAPSALTGSMEVRFHLLTTNQLARIRPLHPRSLAPGEEGLCVIHLRQPVTAVRGDRFILRRTSPATTIGGGAILEPGWRKPRGRDLALHLERQQGTDDEVIREWIAVSKEAGTSAADLARKLSVPVVQVQASIESLLDRGLLLVAGSGSPSTRLLSPAVVEKSGARAGQLLRDFLKENRLAPGMPKAEFLSALLPRAAQPLGGQYLDWLVAAKVLSVQGDRVNLPGRATGITDEESKLAQRMVELFEKEGLAPRSPPELQRDLNAAPKVFEGLLRYLTRERKIIRLPSGLFVSAKALEDLKSQVLAQPWTEIAVGDFKDHFGLSRKWAIPLLEYLDAQQVTRRSGSTRIVLR